ncbi:hypothetical protein VCA_003058 [Vibrio albensis VL426]|nr:hypothetical protein VCA_003058 [Vibrio cholerae VL426]
MQDNIYTQTRNIADRWQVKINQDHPLQRQRGSVYQ